PIGGPEQPPSSNQDQSSIHVRCRPITNPVGNYAGALHCYIVTKRANAFIPMGIPYIQTIEGRRVPSTPVEQLAVDQCPGENGCNDSTNKPSDPEIRWFNYRAVNADISCMEATAKMLNEFHSRYCALGPNSNSAVYTILNICKRPVTLPPAAVGWNVPLGTFGQCEP